MTLRSRLLIGLGLVILVLIAAGIGVARAQEHYLVQLTDRQLTAAAPMTAIDPQLVPQELLDNLRRSPDAQFLDLYVAEFDPATGLSPLLTGRLLDDEPEITAARLGQVDGDEAHFTVSGRSGDRFRVLARRLDGDRWSILALSLDLASAANNRLLLTLGGAGAILLVAVATIAWWVSRLGLRPIRRLTETAEAITAGRRNQRVDVGAPGTEVGRLGLAFNQMLDERDALEARQRQFVADASHELRTPLTSIRGYVDLLANGGFPRPDERNDAFRRLRAESHRMQDLVEDLLLLSSLDQGRPLADAPVDLADVLSDAAADAQAVEPNRPVDIVLSEAGGLLVGGDGARLRQVVGSLVHNALVHTAPSTPIQLVGRRTQTEVVVEIRDGGPGLDPADAAVVFDRFTRIDPGRSRHRGGNGLGLSIARSLVEAHGGRLRLETAPGSGCTFIIGLPALQPIEANGTS